jgi:hypothetical protein
VLIHRDVTLPRVRSELFKITPSRERETTGPEPQRFPPAPPGEWRKGTPAPMGKAGTARRSHGALSAPVQRWRAAKDRGRYSGRFESDT